MKTKNLFLYLFSVLFLLRSLEAQTGIYEDGKLTLRKIGIIEGRALGLTLATPPEIGGVMLWSNDIPNIAKPKKNLYLWKDGNRSLICGDDTKEFVERGETLNPIALPLKDGLYVSTSDSNDPLRRGHVENAFKCSYDGKTITHILGMDDLVELSTRSGKKNVKSSNFLMPFPSQEEGVYFLVAQFHEYPSLRFMESGTYRFNTKTMEAVEISTIPVPAFPASSLGNGIWTDGNSFLARLAGNYSDPYKLSLCTAPRTCNSLITSGGVVNGELLDPNRALTYDFTRDDGFDTNYVTMEGKGRFVHCNFTCLTYLKTEDFSEFGPFLGPSAVPYADPCLVVTTGTDISKETAVLMCRGEAPRPFLKDGIFPDKINSRYYTASTPDRKGAYIFRACPGQKVWEETCWESWEASIIPPPIYIPPEGWVRRR